MSADIIPAGPVRISFVKSRGYVLRDFCVFVLSRHFFNNLLFSAEFLGFLNFCLTFFFLSGIFKL
jgi:hypothetical protein